MGSERVPGFRVPEVVAPPRVGRGTLLWLVDDRAGPHWRTAGPLADGVLAESAELPSVDAFRRTFVLG